VNETPVLRPLTNPVQAAALEVMLPLTPIDRRLPLAAAFLGTTSTKICDYAGVTLRKRHYYSGREKDHPHAGKYVPFVTLRKLALALGVNFLTLWDDEAMDDPARLIAGGSQPYRATRGRARPHLAQFKGRQICA
jgi:hypothetical protein